MRKKVNAKQEVNRLWGDTPVVEAKKNLRVFLLPQDVKNAERQDPQNCAFVRAVQRACGAKRALFFKSIAYVELMQSDGSLMVERFKMPSNMRSIIEQFDKTGVSPSGGFTLYAPPPGLTLNAKAVRQKKREAALKGTSRSGMRIGKPIHMTARGHKVAEDNVRYGTGQVHFTPLRVRESNATSLIINGT